MLAISYTISPLLTRYLEKIEVLRRNMLLYPVSPKDELKLRFDATIQRIFYGLTLHGVAITQEAVVKTLDDQIHFVNKKKNAKIDIQTQQITHYKKALDYIKQEWLVNKSPVTTDVLLKLYSFLSKEKLRVSKQQLQEVLDYLQVSSDNPFIQAGVAKLVFTALNAFPEENDVFATLCSYLFLYKSGLDCRGLLILEEAWSHEANIYKGQYKLALSQTNITGWLEYFNKAISLHLERSYHQLTQKTFLASQPAGVEHFELNERQKAILTLFDNPAAVVTNRDIQKQFTISQITASRDLAKLTQLGLLYVHGKGRSVRYTRT